MKKPISKYLIAEIKTLSMPLNMELILIKSIVLLAKYSVILNIIVNWTIKKQRPIYFKLETK